MCSVYFGPVRPLPSWYWVGHDVAECLRPYFDIRYFTSSEEIASGSVVFWVKAPPKSEECAKLMDKRLKIIYLPVDQYGSESELAAHTPFHLACKLIVVHLKSMRALFPGLPVQVVDHYNKFGIDMKYRDPTDLPLWIGGYQYLPYVIYYLRQQGIDTPVNVLTDHRTPSAITAACRLGHRLEIDADFSNPASLQRLKIYEWNEARQAEMLRTCSSAFDYKHVEDFNQRFKPPTKLQKYAVSGIPLAINRDSQLHAHMLEDGINLCSFADTETLTSPRYSGEVAEYGAELAQRLRIDFIATRYVEFVESL